MFWLIPITSACSSHSATFSLCALVAQGARDRRNGATWGRAPNKGYTQLSIRSCIFWLHNNCVNSSQWLRGKMGTVWRPDFPLASSFWWNSSPLCTTVEGAAHCLLCGNNNLLRPFLVAMMTLRETKWLTNTGSFTVSFLTLSLHKTKSIDA